MAGKPSEMHDALQAILGLDALIDAERRLNDTRKDADAASKQAKQALPDLLALLAGHADERARRAEALLAQGSPDIDAISALAAGAERGDDELSARLTQITAVTLPAQQAVDEAIAALTSANQRVGELAGTAAADARRMAGLLGSALQHFADSSARALPGVRRPRT